MFNVRQAHVCTVAKLTSKISNVCQAMCVHFKSAQGLIKARPIVAIMVVGLQPVFHSRSWHDVIKFGLLNH